ncbi:hypothetical protein [Paenibacillus xylanexedens]|nr:hypothetical protein [Paenibacillus xylanexedens]
MGKMDWRREVDWKEGEVMKKCRRFRNVVEMILKEEEVRGILEEVN